MIHMNLCCYVKSYKKCPFCDTRLCQEHTAEETIYYNKWHGDKVDIRGGWIYMCWACWAAADEYGKRNDQTIYEAVEGFGLYNGNLC